MHKIRNLVEDWRPQDSQKLTVLENESEKAWPGGGGSESTPEEIERWLKDGDHLGVFVSEEGDKMVSICTLVSPPGQREHSYIPHLLCHPDYHGKKYGKAVLHAAVDYVYRQGYGKVDLHTWSGNMKAVPLYKKTGFMWKPDTSVFMENLTPAARRHPLAQAYFAKHDWYDTIDRTYELEHDLLRRGQVRVYQYRWQAPDGDFLRMVFDRQSWRPIEIETPELLVGCQVGDEKLVAGRSHPISWRLINRAPDKKRVFLSAGGDPGIQIERRANLELEGEALVEGQFVIDPEIAAKNRDPKAALVATEVVVGETALELSAGIEVKQAVDIDLEPWAAALAVGGMRPVMLTLRSNLDEAASVHLVVRPLHNAKVAKRGCQVELAARQGTELSLEVAALAPGPLALAVEARAKVGDGWVPIKTKQLDLVGVRAGAVAGGVGQERAVLCSDGLLVVVSRRSGAVDVHHRLRGFRYRRLHLPRPQLGPPFSEGDLFQEKGEAVLEEEGSGVALRLRSVSVSRPGMVFERCIRIDQRPLVQVVDQVANGGPRPLDIQRQQHWQLQQGRSGGEAQWCVPRPDGVVAHSWNRGGRDLNSIRLPEKGDQWPEGWQCLEGEDGSSSAMLWDRAGVVGMGSWGNIKQDGGRIKAGETKALAPICAFVGDGTYQTVRSWWNQLFGAGPTAEGPAPRASRSVVQLDLQPQPLLLRRGRGTARLQLQSAGTHKLSGTVTLAAKGPLAIKPAAVDVADLTWDRPLDKRIELKASGKQGGPAAVQLEFDTDEFIYRGAATALVLPADPKPVLRRREGDLVLLDNGLVRAQIAPDFLGSVVSLKRGGVEYLNSSYPEAGVRDWRNPWHGGIHPVCNRLWGTLHQERFRPRLIRRRGAQGLSWSGVRLTCLLQQDNGRGLQLELEYLLAPGVDMLAVVARCTDIVGVSSYSNVGFNLWPAFGDRPGSARFERPNSDGPIGLAAPHWAENTNWAWGGLVGNNGRAIFTCGRGAGARTGGWAGGDEGCGLFGEVTGVVPAQGGIEGLFFVGPYTSAKAAEKGAVWARFEQLP